MYHSPESDSLWLPCTWKFLVTFLTSDSLDIDDYEVHTVDNDSYTLNATAQISHIQSKGTVKHTLWKYKPHISLSKHKVDYLSVNKLKAIISCSYSFILSIVGLYVLCTGLTLHCWKKTHSDGPWMSNSLWTLSNMLVVSCTDISTTCECKLG